MNIREEIEDYSLEKEIKPISKVNPLMEELKNELKGNAKPIDVEDMRKKIKLADSKDTLTQLTEEIKNGDFSEEEKVEIRKVFKEKKNLLSHQKSDVGKESIRSIKNTFNNN